MGVVGSLCDNEKELGQRKTNKHRKLPEVQKKQNKKLAAILGEEDAKERKEFNKVEKIVVEGLQKLISKNSKLMHLDLSDTGLSEDMILEIAKAVNVS